MAPGPAFRSTSTRRSMPGCRSSRFRMKSPAISGSVHWSSAPTTPEERRSTSTPASRTISALRPSGIMKLFTRASFAEGRATLSANLFYNDISDAQRAQSRPYTVPGGATAFWAEIQNVPAAESHGLEVELEWLDRIAAVAARGTWPARHPDRRDDESCGPDPGQRVPAIAVADRFRRSGLAAYRPLAAVRSESATTATTSATTPTRQRCTSTEPPSSTPVQSTTRGGGQCSAMSGMPSTSSTDGTLRAHSWHRWRPEGVRDRRRGAALGVRQAFIRHDAAPAPVFRQADAIAK